MKKIRAILSLLLIFVFVWGCGQPQIYINLTQPWQQTYEQSIYDVSFYYYLTQEHSNLQDIIIKDSLDNSAKIEIADGTLEYTIEQVDAQKNTWKLTANLKVEYLSKEELENLLQDEFDSFENALKYTGVENLGVTDTMTSSIIFSMQKGRLFQPLKVSKKYDMPSAKTYLDYTFDYQTRVLSYKYDEAESKITYKAKEIKSGYDNEQLLLLVRAVDRDSFQPGFSTNFSKIYNWTDTLDRGGMPTTYNINMSINRDEKNIPIKDDFLRFVENDITEVDNEKRLPVYEVRLSNNSTYEAGPDLTAWYSQMDIFADDSYAKTVMIKTVQNLYDVSTTRKIFCMSYDITSIKIANE